MRSKKVFLYDTTLRDGAQAEDIAFSLEDKQRITRRLDELFSEEGSRVFRISCITVIISLFLVFLFFRLHFLSHWIRTEEEVFLVQYMCFYLYFGDHA